jgi:hypothetical protein
MPPSLSPQTTPYYGGGQVANPANVIRTSGAPSTVLTEDGIGTLAVDNAAGNIYGLASKAGGEDTWVLLGGASGAISAVNGTAAQITATTAGNIVTLSLPSAITAPGSLTTTTSLASTTTMTAGTGLTVTSGGATITAGGLTVTAGGAAVTGTTTINTSGAAVTTIGTGGTGAVNIGNATGNTAVTGSLTASTTLTATLGNITATNGNLNLAHTGNKLLIHASTAASDSIGTATLASGTVTVSTTAVTASSLIFLSYKNCASSLACSLSYGTIMAGASFVITSQDLTDSTSTVNYWIIN